jgi:hypothetical protein
MMVWVIIDWKEAAKGLANVFFAVRETFSVQAEDVYSMYCLPPTVL